MIKQSIVLFLLTFLWIDTLPVYAQVPPFHCLGSCPKVSLSPSGSRGFHPVGSNSISTSPSPAVSISPSSSSAPAPSSGQIAVSPAPSTTAPCINQQQQQKNNYYRSWGKRRRFKPHGVLQQSTASIWQLILQLLQQLGIQIPGLTTIPCSTGTPTIGGGGGGNTPSINPIPSTSSPSGGGGGPSVNPIISTGVTTATPSLAPTSAASPTNIPSSGTTTVNLPDDNLGSWAGYVYTVAQGTTNATIASTWNNSSVTCSTKGIVSPWPGFGGYNSGDGNIAQLGEDFDCSSGKVAYNPWTEAYPANSVYYNNPTSAGDSITAKVTFTGNGHYTTTMTDTTKGWTITTPMTFTSGTLTPQTGDVIVEQLGSGAIPTFSPINFTNSDYSMGGSAAQGISAAPKLTKMDLGSGKNATTTTSSVTGGTFTISKL